MENKKNRVFKKAESNYYYGEEQKNQYEILELDSEKIEKVVNFGNEDLIFRVDKQDLFNFNEWIEISDSHIPIQEIEEYIIIDNSILENWFLSMVFKEVNFDDIETGYLNFYDIEEIENYFNNSEELKTGLKKQFAELKNIQTTIDNNTFKNITFCDMEIYKYWDGSNHHLIELTGSNIPYDLEWIEVTEEDEYIIKEELSHKDLKTGYEKIVKTEDGSIYKIHVTLYQSLTDTWELLS